MVNKLKLALVPFLDKADYDLNVEIESNFEASENNDDKWTIYHEIIIFKKFRYLPTI